MEPIIFPEANLILMGPAELAALKGEELKDNPFEGIPIQDLHVFTDGTSVVTCWQMDEADMEILKSNGGKIYLKLLTGRSQPPLCIGVENPLPPVENQVLDEIQYQALDERFGFGLDKIRDYFENEFESKAQAWKTFWAKYAGI